MIAAKISVEWGYEIHSIVLIPRNWTKVKARKPLTIRRKGYDYEGQFFWDYWVFGGGLDGSLEVCYSDLITFGFTGDLSDADISEFDYDK
jgi:hypothetical protein